MRIFKIITTVTGAAALYGLWQLQELMHINRTYYTVHSEKLKARHRFVVLADLHLWRYGRHNRRLLAAIREEAPEAIFLPGDLIVHTKPERFFVAEELMRELVRIAPVYFSNGNHESRLECPGNENYEAYQALKKRMRVLGVHILNNCERVLSSGGDRIVVHGLELPLYYYKKGCERPLAPNELTRCLGRADTDDFHVLLAHTPKYTSDYFSWGADLCLSGHYHGGLVCIPGIGSVVSPQLELFPRYSFGRYEKDGHVSLVSRGMGTHTFHIRIFNRSELLVVTAGGE